MGCGFVSLGESWCDTTTDVGRLVMTIMGGIAEFERSLIRKRLVPVSGSIPIRQSLTQPPPDAASFSIAQIAGQLHRDAGGSGLIWALRVHRAPATSTLANK